MVPRVPLIVAMVALFGVVVPASADQAGVPPDPSAPHGNLCPRSLTGTYDASMDSLGLINVGTALQLENGMLVTPQSSTSTSATYLLYLAYGSTVQVQPASISGNGWVLNTQPLGDAFGVSCDVTNVNDTMQFTVHTSLLKR
jgi:hypothetical protein